MPSCIQDRNNGGAKKSDSNLKRADQIDSLRIPRALKLSLLSFAIRNFMVYFHVESK